MEAINPPYWICWGCHPCSALNKRMWRKRSVPISSTVLTLTPGLPFPISWDAHFWDTSSGTSQPAWSSPSTWKYHLKLTASRPIQAPSSSKPSDDHMRYTKQEPCSWVQGMHRATRHKNKRVLGLPGGPMAKTISNAGEAGFNPRSEK